MVTTEMEERRFIGEDGFSRETAFICQSCQEAIGDPAYCGPWGHAPRNICFTCWVNAFERPPLHWPREVLALWFLSNGYTRAETARKCGVRTRTVLNWLMRIQKNISHFSELVSDLDDPFCSYLLLGRTEA